jgi:hypothetical protein
MKGKHMHSKTSTYQQFVKNLNSVERKQFEEGYRDHLVSELHLAIAEKDDITTERLAQALNTSVDAIKELPSKKKKAV